MSVREQFLCALFNGPLLPADALVVFSGDGKVRLHTAVGALRQRAAHHVLVSGGVDDPPHSLHADDMRRYLIERGLAPDRIVVDADSLNTREQAVRLASECLSREWETVTLVATHYHLPRAFLTVLQALAECEADKVLVLPLPAPAKWWEAPPGLDVTRMDLLADEFRKIDEYGALGHVANYEDGLAYMRRWETAEVAP